MTFVLANLTFISPTFSAPDDKIEQKRKSLIQYDQKVPVQAPAPVATSDSEENDEDETPKYFFSHDESISLRTGGAIDFKELEKTDGDKDIPILLGLRYMLPSSNSKHQEHGVDLLMGDKSRLYLQAGYKYIIDHTNGLRPYYKFGVSMRFDEGDHMETPFDFKSYAIVGSVGLEDLIKDPHSFRVDLDIHVGREDFLALVVLGYSLAF